jgi:TonB-linked SusC/RagA family outer membrane protein
MIKSLRSVFFVVCLVIPSLSFAQDKTLSGRVTSTEDGTPIPGVNVVLKGTTVGTSTDADGKYAFSIPATGGTLIFSFIGLESKEIEIGDRTVVDVTLALDVTQLNEVVVVGYGVQERKKVSSSISSLKGEQIANLATPSFIDQLSGRAAGVQVTVATGIIGQIPAISIRGINSLTQGTFPLVVIDGIPMTSSNQSGIPMTSSNLSGSTVTPTNPLADINPADIQSYEILKDGAASAIYGSRAANGVILITTKRGTKGKPKVEFSASTGYSESINRFDLLDAEQFVQVANEKLANGGLAPAAFMDANNTYTDWQDVVLRKGAFSNYNLNLGGATESTNYYFSVGYQYQEGNVVNNDFERFTFRTNVDHKLNKFLKFGTGVNYTRSLTTGLNTGANALSGNLVGAVFLFPNVPVKDPTNATGYNLSANGQALGQGANTRSIDNNYTNQGFVLENNKLETTADRFLANVYGDVTLMEGLSFRTNFGIDYLTSKDFQSLDPRHGDGRGVVGLVFNQDRDVLLWNWQNMLNFNRDFGVHGIDAVVGLEYQKQTFSSFFGQGTNVSDIFFIQNNLINGSFGNQFAGGNYNQTAFDSYFGRVNYSLQDKYLFGFSVRNDGLSRLAEDKRRGTFYGASVGYRVSEESFFKNSGINSVVNDLKIRASYAEVGNTDIGLFPYAALYRSARYGSQNGIAFLQPGNGDLQWETSKKLNVGADFGFMNNRIGFTFDYFVNDIDGNILNVPYAVSLGIPTNAIRQNIGVVRNSGLEFSANATALNKGGFVWNVNANFTTVKNEVIETFKNTAGDFAEIGVTGFQIQARVGEPIDLIFGYIYAGVNSANGNPMYVKGNGSIVQRNVNTGGYSFYDPNDPTNEANTSGAPLNPADVSAGGDRKVLGHTQPKWFGGLTNTFTYKGLSLEIFVRFSGGNKVYNLTKQGTLLTQDFTNSGTELLKSWTPENPNTDVPKMWINRSAQVNQAGSAISRFVEDGDFVRIQNIVLGYDLPKAWLDKTGKFPISNVRLFAQVQNAFTFTKYSGLDPELGAGVDNNQNPLNRIYTLGLNIGL